MNDSELIVLQTSVKKVHGFRDSDPLSGTQGTLYFLNEQLSRSKNEEEATL